MKRVYLSLAVIVLTGGGALRCAKPNYYDSSTDPERADAHAASSGGRSSSAGSEPLGGGSGSAGRSGSSTPNGGESGGGSQSGASGSTDGGTDTRECPQGAQSCEGTCLPVGKSCAGQCSSGLHDCNGDCVSEMEVATCGTNCKPCEAPLNADPTCDGTTAGSSVVLVFTSAGRSARAT